jgi:hypothetical protein
MEDKYITSYPEGEKKIVWFEFILESDDYSEGQLYKWKRWKDEPISLLLYISNILPGIFKASYDKIARIGDKGSPEIAKYYNEIKKNFAATIRNLGNHSFKKNVINEASLLFHREGFANELDSDPLIRGVSNGILKLSNLKYGKPELITGYHTYSVSKFTKVKYIPFDPFDEITKKLIISLRRLFPDDEPDTFEFVMYYLASTIDSLPKESVFLQMIGGGSNGKSFLMELHIAAIGELYGKKLASMHKCHNPNGKYGWKINNTIGATLQPNNECDTWAEFWDKYRLGHMLDLCKRDGAEFGKKERFLSSFTNFSRSVNFYKALDAQSRQCTLMKMAC